MKKLSWAACATAALVFGGAAKATTMEQMANGFVVPHVIHNGGTYTTAVGITNHTERRVPVYWYFHSEDGEVREKGCFVIAAKDFRPFIWSDVGASQAGVRGYLLFAAGDATVPLISPGCPSTSALAETGDRALLSANAFQVNLSASDVAYVPIVGGPVGISAGNLGDPGGVTVNSIEGASGTLNKFSARYYIDGAPGGTDTQVILWSRVNQQGTYTMSMYDNKSTPQSVSVNLPKKRLNVVDPENIAGRPDSYLEGYLEWNLVKFQNFLLPSTHALFIYSVIDAPTFGAVQTILGAVRN